MQFDRNTVADARFLNMPLGSQALYFQLGTNADADGFIYEPNKVIARTHAASEDMRILISNGYVTTSNVSSGIYVKSEVC